MFAVVFGRTHNYVTCLSRHHTELANNYKDDGNFNYKHRNYRLAILSYTEGIKTKCKDTELMAQLYNNRAAANFMLKNYRYKFCRYKSIK